MYSISKNWIKAIINNSVVIDGSILVNFKIATVNVPIHLNIAIYIDWPEVFPLFKSILTNNIDIIKFCIFAINPDVWVISLLNNIEKSFTDKIINNIEQTKINTVKMYSDFLLIIPIYFLDLYPYLKKVYNIIKSSNNQVKNIIFAKSKFTGAYIKLKVNSQARLRLSANKGIP